MENERAGHFSYCALDCTINFMVKNLSHRESGPHKAVTGTSHICLLASPRVFLQWADPLTWLLQGVKKVMLFLCSGCELIRFALVYCEIQVNSFKAYTETLMNKAVPISITATKNSLLILHSFLLTESNMNAEILYRSRFQSSLPSNHNQSSWETRSPSPYSICLFLQVYISLLNYIYTPLPTYIWPTAMLIALQPHLLHILLSHLLSSWVKATISIRAPRQSCTV